MRLDRRLPAGALVLLAVALGGCTAAQERPAAKSQEPSVIVPGAPGEPAVTMPAGEARKLAEKVEPTAADISYMQQMMTHHQQAIEMTDLAQTRVGADDVRGIAARIGDSQQPEIELMRGWLRRHDEPVPGPDAHGAHGGTDHGAHGGMDHGGMGHGGKQLITMTGMASAADLDDLSAANGAGFDRLFLRLMIAHHEGAVRMAEDLLGQDSADPIVEQLAQDVIATQTDEIGRMRGMQAS